MRGRINGVAAATIIMARMCVAAREEAWHRIVAASVNDIMARNGVAAWRRRNAGGVAWRHRRDSVA